VNVTLDQTTNPWTLQVDTNPIDIPPNANPQSIHWHLVGIARGGKFKSLTGAEPGFEWNGPSPLPFDDPTLSPKKIALTIKDNHTNAASKGEWPYILRIVLNGTTYRTSALTVKARAAKTKGGMGILGTQNPTIKNN
jgi:hypothetical protein